MGEVQSFKDRAPFQKQHLDEEGKSKDVVSVNLDAQERKMLEEAKRILEQEKDSTALKQLAYIGFKSMTREENAYLLAVVFANKRRNKRLGITEFEL
jgi:hypothetical protein